MHTINISTMIDALRNFELTVSLLYETYSTVLPSDKFKWQSFAAEEKMHAKWLGGMKLFHTNQLVSLNDSKITIHSIHTHIGYIQEQIDKARHEKITTKDAVLTALQIEDSILESSFLKIFKFNTPKGKAVKRRLIHETTNHRDKMTLWLEMIEDQAQLVV